MSIRFISTDDMLNNITSISDTKYDLMYKYVHDIELLLIDIGPDGPELICHLANKFLYQKC